MASNRGSPGNSLSKDRLKNELVAHGLPLPPSGSKKEVYVQLYEKNVVANSSGNLRSEFSSDEDERSPKLYQRKIRKSVFTSVNHEDDDDISLVVGSINIAELSDEELQDRLRSLKFKPGPIVDSTRQVYQRKLARLMRGQVDGEVSHSRFEEDFSDSDDTESRHSATPNKTHHRHSPKANDFSVPSELTDVRRRLPGDSTANSKPSSPYDDISAFHRPDFNRDTPTPRRSLSQASTPNSNKESSMADSSDNNNLASRLLEQVDDPELPRRSRKYLFLIALLVIVFVILALLVYQNMEDSTSDQIDNIVDKLDLAGD